MKYFIEKHCPFCTSTSPLFKNYPFNIVLSMDLNAFIQTKLGGWIEYKVINYEGKCLSCQKTSYVNGTIRKSLSDDLSVLGDNLRISKIKWETL
ncbi:hypothetical protein ACI1UM_03825 [Lactococcus petauri]|uniref:hypothetical protein n=1 Tax=Lactococcus petauri TaxID=1940789 RepID=UPI0038555CA3